MKEYQESVRGALRSNGKNSLQSCWNSSLWCPSPSHIGYCQNFGTLIEISRNQFLGDHHTVFREFPSGPSALPLLNACVGKVVSDYYHLIQP